MKASLKLREDQHHQQQNPLARVKVPVSILGFPFISSFTAGDPKDFSFNLHSNFLTGPSLKLSYSPTTTINHNHNRFTLSLKSGVGLFGSPNNSPLVISAHFNLFGNPNPTFSLQIKPNFGDFSFSKTAVSSPLSNPNPNPNPNPIVDADLPKENGGFPYTGFVPERPVIMRNIHPGEYDFFSGVAVKAKTVFPVAKYASVKFRWGVKFPTKSDEKLQLPFLTVDKISIERAEGELDAAKIPVKSGISDKIAELEVLKGMCFWMRKEVDGLQRENSAIKESLEEMKMSSLRRNRSESNKVVSLPPSNENSNEFENWRNKKKNGVEDNRGRRESKKLSDPESSTSDVGEELKKAIKAASSK